jgi:hypothetical protein
MISLLRKVDQSLIIIPCTVRYCTLLYALYREVTDSFFNLTIYSIPGGIQQQPDSTIDPPLVEPLRPAFLPPQRRLLAKPPTTLTPTRLVPSLRPESRPYRLPPAWFDQLDNHLLTLPLVPQINDWFPG